jgi:hypothetical protein
MVSTKARPSSPKVLDHEISDDVAGKPAGHDTKLTEAPPPRHCDGSPGNWRVDIFRW